MDMEASSEDEDGAADINLYSPSSIPRKRVGYKQAMKDILTGIPEEFDSRSLEDLQLKLGAFDLDKDLYTELLNKKTLLGIYGILLRHTKNDFRQLILILNDVIPSIIYDLHPTLRDTMQKLAATINEENKWFELTDRRVMHGREDDLKQLTDLMRFNKSQKVRLVNVCGMTGIGKSFLVKNWGSQLLNEGEDIVLYVNASGVTELLDLAKKILQHPYIGAVSSGSLDQLKGTFYEFLKTQEKCQVVLIIDDLSALMAEAGHRTSHSSSTCRTEAILSYLNELVKKSVFYKIKLKLLVTSQIHIKMVSERSEVQGLLNIKQKMADYTEDLSLSRLSNETAMKFLGPSMQSLGVLEKEALIEQCAGHPYSLYNVSAMAEVDRSYTTEMTKVSPADIGAFADLMFEKAFSSLSDIQKLILLAVALFDRDASQEALLYILNSGQSVSKQGFYHQMTKEFGNGFWLTILVCDIRSGPNRKRLVNFHHPLIKKFIKGKIDLYRNENSSDYGYYMKMKRRYVEYHIDELIDIGRECVPLDAMSNDYIPRTCSRFMHGGANFRITFWYILEIGDPTLIFMKGSTVRELRDDSSLVHFFLCIHQFYDSFDKFLPDVLEQLINLDISDPREKVLIWTLYVMVLVIEKNWISLNSVLENRLAEADPKLIISTSPGLYRFCKAIYGYATGALYTNASWLKESTDPELINNRIEALTDGRKSLNLQHLSEPTTPGGMHQPSWLLARKYFSVQILLVLAEATRLANPSNVVTIREAFKLCKEARNAIQNQGQNPEPSQQVLILEPMVYIKLAYYRSLEGDLPSVSEDVAKDRYREALGYHDKITEQLKCRRLDTSSMAARNDAKSAIVMRSWAYRVLLASVARPTPDTVPKGAREIALRYLKTAQAKFFVASQKFEMLSHTNNQELLNSYVDIADTADQLRTWTPKYNASYREKCHGQTCRYYNKAYNLLRSNYRSCHLSANTRALETLIDRLPKVMGRSGQEEFEISKVEGNLKHIRDEASKAASNFEFSGSALFVYNSSGSESSDDDFVSSGDSELVLAHSLAAMDTSTPSPTEAIAEEVTRTSSSDKNFDEEPSHSKKRKL